MSVETSWCDCMMTAKTINLSIRLYGMREKDASIDLVPRTVRRGTSVQEIWSELQNKAKPGERLVTTPHKALLVLVNGQPVDYGDGWDTVLKDGDELTFMIKASGG